ncbi:MAG: SPOR domain-containing protein [Rhodospirillales bacterium]
MARRPKSDIRVSASDALEFEPEPKRRRGIPTTIWLLLVMVLVTAAGLGGFLFGDRLAGLSGDNGDQVPVVHAAQGPIKVRPKNPGGQEIPFRDYDINKRMQGEEPTGRVENLLPPPEQPKAPPQAATDPATITPASPAKAAPPAAKTTGSSESLLPSAPAPAPKPTAPQTVTAQQITPQKTTPKPVAPPPPTTVAKAPPPQPAPPPPAPAQSAPTAGSGPLPLVPKSQQKPSAPAVQEPSSAAPKETAKAAPPPPAAPKIGADSSWQVQLAASRSATAAKAEGERLKKKHTDVLGGMSVNVVRADLGAKGVFYRIRLGPAGDKAKARTVCSTLSKRGQGCLVVAPGK